MPTLPSRPRTVAELIRGHQHPIVSYQTQSTTTKTVSKAERALHSQLKRVTANSDWVEDIKNRYNFDLEITDDYYESHPRLRSAIDTSLMAETYTERQELDTHTFHRDHILLAAIRIVAAYVDLGGLCNNAPFSAAVREVISSLKTRPGNRTDDSLIYPDHEVCIDAPLEQRWLANPPPSALREAHLLLVEDKTHRVMTKGGRGRRDPWGSRPDSGVESTCRTTG
ncbi:hypothetical protein C8R47DRAFT_752603 [Mycena vitilis]|nr:hypothetical protein C8R47DRAFT_752603 [Mycena vitilis]